MKCPHPASFGEAGTIHRSSLSRKRAMGITEAFFAPSEIVPHTEAIGRVSADSLAAYPPGVPNVLPGEVLSAEAIAFLRQTAAAPSGYVQGAFDSELSQFRVVAEHGGTHRGDGGNRSPRPRDGRPAPAVAMTTGSACFWSSLRRERRRRTGQHRVRIEERAQTLPKSFSRREEK